MSGSVYQHKGRPGWSITYDIGRDPATGRRRQKAKAGYPTKRAAQKALTAILADLDRGIYTEPSKLSVAELLAEWLTGVATSLRPSTHHSYAKNVRLHVIPYVGAIPVQQLDPGHLNVLYATLLREGHSTGGGLSPRTVRYIHQIVRRALADAVAWGRIGRNPADLAKPPSATKAKSSSAKAWTANEEHRFLTATKTDPEWTIYLVLATTGMRRGEALGMRWCDLDLDTGALSICRSLTTLAGVLSHDEPKTSGSRRRIALDERTTTALRAHRAHQAALRLAGGPTWANCWDLVFTTESGAPIDPDAFSGRFGRRVAALGLPLISPHGLRHTWASIALSRGINPKVVSERLGHASIAITLSIYSHVSVGLDSGAAELVASAIWE